MDIRKVKKLIELLEEIGRRRDRDQGRRGIGPHQPASDRRHVRDDAAAPIRMRPPAAPGRAAGARRRRGPRPPQPARRRRVRGPGRHRADGRHVLFGVRRPAPSRSSNIGREVKPGDVLCIIEAMKMMNQIESDKAGRIVSVLAKNGDPVEFGQPLFVIE